MKIFLSPQRRDDTLEVSRNGDVLTVNGAAFDFSQIGEGDSLPPEAINSQWFVAPVTRVGGNLQVTLILPLPLNFSPAQAFPEPLMVSTDGPVAFPQPLPALEATMEPQA